MFKWSKSNLATKASVVSLVSLLSTSSVWAAGFQIQEQNALYLGTAYSGTAAWAADASSAYYNAAGLTHLPHQQIVVSGNLLYSYSKFTASQSNMPVNPNTPVSGSQTDKPGGLSLIPAIHYGSRLNDRWVFGFSIATPFGLKTNYDENQVMRYLATKSELKTLNFSPSLAYKINDSFSVAAGPDMLYVQAQLEAMTNLGTPSDGFQRNRAEDWGLGWHAGVLMELAPTTRVGLHYRSRVNLHAKGDSEQLSFVPAPELHTIRQLSAKVTLPESMVLSGYHQVNEQWAMTADVQWTKWSRVQVLPLRFEGATDTDTQLHFKNATRLALGANYQYDTKWQFRAGGAYDKTPVQNEHRTARVPDADRVWLSLGVSYAPCPGLNIDMGYAHIFFKHASLNDTGLSAAGSSTPLLPHNLVKGKFNSNANILGIQIRYDFV